MLFPAIAKTSEPDQEALAERCREQTPHMDCQVQPSFRHWKGVKQKGGNRGLWRYSEL